MKSKVLNAIFVVFAAALPPATLAEIHRCTDEYGNVAFLQLPCPVESREAVEASDESDSNNDDEEEGDGNPKAWPESEVPPPPVPSSRLTGELLEDCKKRYRDRIDEIDAEMRTGFSLEQGEMYKEKLRALTQQLRACG
ncbi:MAG: hypothetical protein OEW68_00105 [Gammaproteobacteria bacterium]|nr:hypothetical protein [Gammaproteobacteria bacterium]MDH4313226.1 hypothetical protein [Gammaproteobacteria bacterium]MDH5213568.1 hypothetical protein [Gammaproteobacteria bacterium]MDH5499794.1 hypothetical protein [Gammaproteobacteria bacterium]